MSFNFSESDDARKAVGFLAGRWSFRMIEDGALVVPEGAVTSLAAEGIRFAVEGKARYEQMVGTKYMRGRASAQE